MIIKEYHHSFFQNLNINSYFNEILEMVHVTALIL
jgi:hypothetical protein